MPSEVPLSGTEQKFLIEGEAAGRFGLPPFSMCTETTASRTAAIKRDSRIDTADNTRPEQTDVRESATNMNETLIPDTICVRFLVVRLFLGREADSIALAGISGKRF